MKTAFLIFVSAALCRAAAADPNSTASFLRGGAGSSLNDFPRRLADHSRALNIYTNSRWKDRVGDVVQVPYYIDSRYFSSTVVQLIESSVQALGDASKVVRFVQRTNQAAYINVNARSGGCFSVLGKSRSGKEQDLNLSQGCLRVGTIQHEFLHALGFTHEQNRPDRDHDVIINLDNIDPEYRDQFEKASGSEVLGATYEYDSVMHYGSNASAIDSSIATIIPRNSGATIGQRAGATDKDIQDVRLLYQCLSGPRTLSEYQDNPCTSDCKCWEGATGCNGNDDACQGSMACQGNTCVVNGGGSGSGGGGTGGGSTGGGCTDTPGWVDIEGDGCDWYEKYEGGASVACEQFGHSFGNAVSGKTANDACCVCGGGSLAGATFWTFENAETPGTCLDLTSSSTTNGNYIIHYPCNGTPAQKWWVDSNYYLRSAVDTNKCIVGFGGRTEQGTNLMISDCLANDDRFVFIYYSDGTFRPKNNYNQCLGPSRTETLISLGVPILHLWDCSDSPHQQWAGHTATQASRNLAKASDKDDPRRALQDECTDVPNGWFDAHGDNCAWYAEGTRCDDYGSANKNFGKTANQACCSCGAGSLVDVAAQDDVLLGDQVVTDNQCWDTPGWTDSVGDSCTWYSQGENCLYYGDEFATEGGNANEACCACGGGSSTAPPVNDSFDAPGCSNIPSDWLDSVGDGCDFYAKEGNCNLNRTGYAGMDGRTASEACCACGGGSTPSDNEPSTIDVDVCNDSPTGWTDIAGDYCSWYGEDEDNCARFGGGNAGEDGRTANEACCICGGGISCSNISDDWTDIAGDDCSWYGEDEDNCARFGSGNAGEDGRTASEVCCICGGGTAVSVARNSATQTKPAEAKTAKRGSDWLPGGFGP